MNSLFDQDPIEINRHLHLFSFIFQSTLIQYFIINVKFQKWHSTSIDERHLLMFV